MFRKIILGYLPEDKNNLSPIHFHLKLLSPKLFYGINLKYGLENRRVIGADTSFSFFDNYNIAFNSLQDENFYYGYKNFSLLNSYNNYNIYTIMPAVSLLCMNKYKDEEHFPMLFKPILYGINYLLLMFYSRFKQYQFDNDKENFDFMIEFLEKMVFHLEYTKKTKQKIDIVEKRAKLVIKLLKKNTDFLMFLYNLTKELEKVYADKKSTDISLYEYLVSANVLDFPDEGEIKKLVKKQAKNIFLKRYTYYIDVDMITMLNLISGDTTFLSYFTNPNNSDYVINYYLDSLSHLDNLNLDNDIKTILDKVYDFSSWSKNFIDSLKEFNGDNIDVSIDPSLGIEKLQEMMSKEMMDNVKKVSSINEQFLDLHIFFITRFIDNNSFTLQNSLIYKNISNSSIQLNKDLLAIYKFLDINYFTNSYFYKTKRVLDKTISYYDFGNKFLSEQIYKTTVNILLNDFQDKSHIEYINTKSYETMMRKYFAEDILQYIKGDIKKIYLNKYFKIIDFKPSDEQIKNFRKNIYYPDFIVYNKFLQILDKQAKKSELITLSRIKETLFGYLVFRKINGYSENIENLYLEGIGLYSKIDFNIEGFYNYFEEKYPEFLSIFSKAKQNQKFVDITKYMLEKYNVKHIYLYDNFKAITYYNKRLFKI